MLKNVIFKLLSLIRFLRWHLQLKQLNNPYKDIPNLKIKPNERILVIAPHADDELIGCHAFLNTHKSQSEVFYCSLLGHNYSEANRTIREQELRSYLDFLDVKYVIAHHDTLLEDLRKEIMLYCPSLIACPSFIDWHKEHRLVNHILQDILSDIELSPKIIWYHISLPIPLTYSNIASHISYREHINKWQLLRRHYKSQLHMDVARFKFVEKMQKSKKAILETYYIQNYREWDNNLKILSDYINDLDKLKNTLGNIYMMSKSVEAFYNKLL